MGNIKNFKQWAKEKVLIEQRDAQKICCKKREIWIAKVGLNIGNEMGKQSPYLRPVLIIDAYLGGDLVLIIPLTTQYKEHLSQFFLEIHHPKLDKKSFAQINQIKSISKKRLQEQVLKPGLNEKYSFQ